MFSRQAKPVPTATATAIPSFKLSIFLMEKRIFIVRNFTDSSTKEAMTNASIKVLNKPVTDAVLTNSKYPIKLAGKTAQSPAIIGINISSGFKFLLRKRNTKMIIPDNTDIRTLINKLPIIIASVKYIRMIGLYKVE